MERYEATFGIESETDLHAVGLLVERADDAFREERRTPDRDDPHHDGTRREFLRSAGRRDGRLRDRWRSSSSSATNASTSEART